MTVAVTTDKGLCGGINSTVCRYVRGMSHMYAAGAQPALSKRCKAALSFSSRTLPACHLLLPLKAVSVPSPIPAAFAAHSCSCIHSVWGWGSE